MRLVPRAIIIGTLSMGRPTAVLWNGLTTLQPVTRQYPGLGAPYWGTTVVPKMFVHSARQCYPILFYRMAPTGCHQLSITMTTIFFGRGGGPSRTIGRRDMDDFLGVHQGATPVAYDVRHRQWADAGDSCGRVSLSWSRRATYCMCTTQLAMYVVSLSVVPARGVLLVCMPRQRVHY